MDSIAPCTPEVCTPGVVVFDPVGFVQSYPAFATVPQVSLESNFQLATLFLNNGCCSVVQDAPTRAQLLNLITAHVTALLNGVNGKPPTGAVGRVSQGTEGSVTATLDYSSTTTESEAFWTQTQWGAFYWRATLPYRLARYVPPQRQCHGYGGLGYYGGGYYL